MKYKLFKYIHYYITLHINLQKYIEEKKVIKHKVI